MTATVDDAFSAALEADAQLPPTELPPPPRKPATVDPDAPHGRNEDGTAKAPYGTKADGKPRIKPAGPGRPKDPDNAARTSSRPAQGPPSTSAGRDFTKDLDDLADGVWMVLSSLPVPGKLKVRLNAQAGLLAAHKPNLVKAGNIAAQNHQGTAQLVEKLTSGNAAWMLPCMFAVGPFVAQSAILWRSPVEDVAELAQQNADNFQSVMSAAATQMQEAA